MRNRSTLLWLPLLVAGALICGEATAGASLPSGTTPVAVTVDNTTTGIDAALDQAASIAGTITSKAGTSSNNKVQALVQVFHGGKFIGTAFSDNAGHYLFGGLAGSATGYEVCVNGQIAFGGASNAGYLGRCYKTTAWNGNLPIPSGANEVVLTQGLQKTGVNIALPSAAAISGKVTSPSGTGLKYVTVTARNRNTGATYYGFSTTSGAYSIKSLPAASKGYKVCADPRSLQSGTGFLPKCHKGAVSVSLGHTHTGIKIAVPRGGAVAGTITDAANGHAVPGVTVAAFSAKGKLLGNSQTNSQGRYLIRSLPPATGDRVCAYPHNTTPSVRYHGKCWKNAAWNGGKLPSSASPVGVRIGKTHTGVSMKLGKTVTQLGSIAGTITAANGGAPLQGANVSVFTNGGAFAGSTTTNASGFYKVSNLRASSTGYVVCAEGDSVSSPTPPATGWAPRCFDDVAWSGVGVPGSATRIPLSAGQDKSGKNIALPDGGAISGTATDAGTLAGAGNVSVRVFNGNGKEVGSASTAFDGTYTVTGLNAGSYTVCFDGRFQFGTAGWRPQCYNGIAWSGTP